MGQSKKKIITVIVGIYKQQKGVSQLMKVYEFDAVIKKQEHLDGAYIEFPYDVEKEFGVKGQVKVKATFDGYEYRGSLAKMKHPCHFLGITQSIRKTINKQPGDTVHVTLMKDDAPRVVEIPQDFNEQLENNEEAKQFFRGLSYSNQKKYVDWITSAKKIETRQKRLNDSITKLLDNKKQP